MKRLLDYLKPHRGIGVLIALILCLQAFCDLSLPSYTSSIVNVGIQQGGIDEEIPYQIGEKQMDSLVQSLNKADKQKVLSYYDLTLKKFNQPAYVFKKNTSPKNRRFIAKKLKRPMVEAVMMQAGKEAGFGKGNSNNTQKEMAKAMSKAKGKIQDLPESMMNQVVTVYIRESYKALGMDMEALQNRYILTTGGKMILLALLSMIVSIIVVLLASRVAASVGKQLRLQMFDKVIHFSRAQMNEFSTASLITRSTNDIQQIQMVTVILFRMILYAPIIGIGGVYKVFQTNADMSWILAVAVALVLLVVGVLFTIVMPRFKVLQRLVDRLNLVTRETLTGLEVIRAFTTEEHEKRRFDEANKELTKTNLFVNRAMTFMMPTMMLIMNGITVLIIWTGAKGVDEGAMQVGDMMAFIQYTMQIIMAFLMICMVSVLLPRAAVAADRIGEVLSSESTLQETDTPVEKEKIEGDVVFDHVSFRYPNAKEDALSDISFVAHKGETTAIIGSTGCGKSTLVQLLPRFYDVTKGSITIGGIDLRQMKESDLREKIGYVPQKGVLFSGTIRSNILFGRENGTQAEMEKAAKIAMATEFIQKDREGYGREIAQGGSNVSGGQKQRLSIARAIAKKPSIYVFDDSFSALDFKTDQKLRKALEEDTKEAVVFIVAQRISTILRAEQIIVLEQGRVAGIGTHKELYTNCEVYRQIAKSQLSESELNSLCQEVK